MMGFTAYSVVGSFFLKGKKYLLRCEVRGSWPSGCNEKVEALQKWPSGNPSHLTWLFERLAQEASQVNTTTNVPPTRNKALLNPHFWGGYEGGSVGWPPARIFGFNFKIFQICFFFPCSWWKQFYFAYTPENYWLETQKYPLGKGGT